MRKVKRLKAIVPVKIPSGQIYDQGTYSINKGDDKTTVEKKLKDAVKSRSFSFILNGNILKGRFIIKQVSGGMVIQKFKDQYASEEDIFGGDLSRTIRLMVPDYDPNAVQLAHLKPSKATRKPAKKIEAPVVEEEPEVITADLHTGKSTYHFDWYQSETGPDLCIISSEKNEVLVLRNNNGKWTVIKGLRPVTPKVSRALIHHATLLFQPGKI